MNRKIIMLSIIVGTVFTVFCVVNSLADEFTKEDLKRWEKEFDAAAKYGRQLWAGTELATNGVSCAQCHPNATNTHPETYPKFQRQIGRVSALWEMINFCIRNPLEGFSLEPDSKEMIALLAYIASERRGVKLDPGKH